MRAILNDRDFPPEFELFSKDIYQSNELNKILSMAPNGERHRTACGAPVSVKMLI